jgi:hypothetical protein
MAITFRGGVSSPVMLGNDATVQTLFCIENGIASRVNVLVRDLDVDLDEIAGLTVVMPLIKTSRGISISGGITLPKATMDTGLTSDPAVVFRSAMVEGAPITATPGDVVKKQYLSRMHSGIEQFINTRNRLGTKCLPTFAADHDFVLRPGENLIVQLVGALGTSNAALMNNFNASCIWEEDQIPTFAISGTVTLSGSPVVGAIVTIIEADDLDMTNAVLRGQVVTAAGGTWASSIRSGKVGAAMVQYRVGGTYYTAPGSPYLE